MSSKNSLKAHYTKHCEKTTSEPVQGTIRGSIPQWLEGTLIQNGPGIQTIGPDHYHHVFDGLAILHRFRIQNGSVTYNSHPLESDSYKKNMAANRIVVGEFGTVSIKDPCKTLFQRIQATFEMFTGKTEATDNCNVSVSYMGDQLYALTETNFIRRIHPETLKTIGEKTNLTKFVAVNHATAHPHVLPDGSILNMGSNYQHRRGPHYCIIKIPPTFGKEETAVTGAELVAEIPFMWWRKPGYYHSFGLVGDKIIFVESPLRLNLLSFLTSPLRNEPFSNSMVWEDKTKTRIHVIPMGQTKLPATIIYEADPFFLFHHINAFEEDGQIVVDAVAYSDATMVTKLFSGDSDSEEHLLRPADSKARRYVLPLDVPESASIGDNLVTLPDSVATATLVSKSSSGEIRIHLEPEYISNEVFELPRINYRFNGLKYNFFYGVASYDQKQWNNIEVNQIVKFDIKSKEITRWTEKGSSPSEPVFVPHPTGTREDDGVILSALSHEGEPDRATLVIIDAGSMTEVGRASFKIAGALTPAFHGQWAGEHEKIHAY